MLYKKQRLMNLVELDPIYDTRVFFCPKDVNNIYKDNTTELAVIQPSKQNRQMS